jgi:hypothetical protein
MNEFKLIGVYVHATYLGFQSESTRHSLEAPGSHGEADKFSKFSG